MYLIATENFKPNDPSTHVPYEFSQQNQEVNILVITTPDEQLIPYKPEDHNDPDQENGIREDYILEAMGYRNYCYKTEADRALQKQAKKQTELTRIPTQEEIAIIKAKNIDAYIAEGFDSIKGDANIKWTPKLHTKDTDILVLENKIFGGAYQSYIPSKHGTNVTLKAIKVANYRSARSTARNAHFNWVLSNRVSQNSNSATTTTTTTSSQAVVSDVPMLIAHTLFLTPSATRPSQPSRGHRQKHSAPTVPVQDPAREDQHKQFAPTVLIQDYASMKLHTNDRETPTTTEQRKRAADDTVPSIPVASNLFANSRQELNQPSQNNKLVEQDQQPKRFRPWEV